MKTILSLSCLVLSLVTAIPSLAQDEKAQADPAFYRLDFVLKEVESGKIVNSRTYSSIISTSGSIRTGNRVPVVTPSLASGLPPNVSFYDTGINIDLSNTKELADRLAVRVSADITSIPATSETPGIPPITRQTKWSSDVIVSFKKPTTIFSFDDPASKRQLQLELTATPIK